MAVWYIRSGATGTGAGTSWANAAVTLTAGVALGAAGDTFFVSEDHAESTAGAVAIAVPGSLATPSFIYCVNHAGSVPPISADRATTGKITTTGTSVLTINGAGFSVDGVIFACGTSGSPNCNMGTTAASWTKFSNCQFQLNSSSAQTLIIGGASSRTILDNCTYKPAFFGDIVQPNGNVVDWVNTSSLLQGGVQPTNFIGNSSAGLTTFRGVDLSGLGPNALNATVGAVGLQLYLIDCKLGASATINTPGGPGRRIDLIRADSGATNYRHERYWYSGTQIVETTIVRTGGATDGTTPISWKIVTTANSWWNIPFESMPIAIWNDTTGSSVTVTIFGIWGGGSVPNNDDIWLHVDYPGSSSTPISSKATLTKADGLATGAGLASDSSTWGGSTTAFKMSVTFTPQMKGPINLVVKAAKASSTFYIDDRPSINGVTVARSYILSPGVYVNELQTGSGASRARVFAGM